MTNTAQDSPKTYNGWTNYETWAVALWLGNDEGTYNQTREMADECKAEAPDDHRTGNIWTEAETAKFLLSDRLKDMCEEFAPDLGATMYADLLNAAMGEVEWDEIAENILSES